MSNTGLGHSDGNGLCIVQLSEMFPDEASARKWFEDTVWPDGRVCPRCEGDNTYEVNDNANRMPYRCRDCKRYFSIKTGSVLEDSKLPLKTWLWAMYLELTSVKGVSSMKIHRDLNVTQKTAWFMLHRIRDTLVRMMEDVVDAPVEIDETYVEGKESNKHADKKLNAGRGTVGKTAVAGAKDRTTGQVRAEVLSDTAESTLRRFVKETVSGEDQLFTDEHKSYQRPPNRTIVNHSTVEWVRLTDLNDLVHTNGLESFWSIFKRAFDGTIHKMYNSHLNRWVQQFAGKYSVRDFDTIDQLTQVAALLASRRPMHKDLCGTE